jgi:hypothetical protein
MSNKKRKLTLVIEITDKEDANWIWDAHIKEPIHGVNILSIGEGDQMSAPNALVEYLRESDLETDISDDEMRGDINDMIKKCDEGVGV